MSANALVSYHGLVMVIGTLDVPVISFFIFIFCLYVYVFVYVYVFIFLFF